MRSVVVVLPASMWAMIPMFRTRSSAMLVATATCFSLPAVVREGLVRLRHPIHVVFALERAALFVERVQQLPRELRRHALLTPVARERDDPADRERAATALRHLDGDLVVRAADAAALHLEDRRHRLHRLLEHLDRRPAGALADDGEGVIDDLLGNRLLPVPHQAVDQLLHEDRPVNRVGAHLARLDVGAARHYWFFLAP